MKKFILLAIVSIMAISVSAVTINWGSGGNVWCVPAEGSAFELATDAEVKANSSIGLFFLGNTGNGLTDVSALRVSDALATSTKFGTKGAASTFALQEYNSVMVADISAGDTYGVYFIYGDRVSSFFTDATLTTAFNSTYTFDGSEPDDKVGIGAFANATATGSTSPVVYAPVPEPATGMLALAGLAMLIRRKRA